MDGHNASFEYTDRYVGLLLLVRGRYVGNCVICSE